MANITTRILNMSGIAAALTRVRDAAYSSRQTEISAVDPNSWPSAGQPLRPLAEGAPPLTWPFLWNQNQNFTPRSDAAYTVGDLRMLSTYPLARMCIDNTKDVLGQIDWSIELKRHPDESKADITARRRKMQKGDPVIGKLSRFLERPTREHDWSEWLRTILENMFVTDASCAVILRNLKGKVAELYPLPEGGDICRYVDDMGRTPLPPSPAYAQLWQGTPRVNLTTDQLIYKPRNIVPRVGVISSYLYGFSPTESMADEIKIGIARLAFTLAYYEKGSLGNVIHVVPPNVTLDKAKEIMQWVNAEMAGNNEARRQWRMIPGFNEEKPDQIIFPDQPVLSDVYDDLHIRKICFAFGTSAQRLQRMMNRGSAQVSQAAAAEEGLKPYMDWVTRWANYIIQVKMGYEDYELILGPYKELDEVKQAKIDKDDVHEGIRTRNQVLIGRGEDPSDNPYADQLMVTTPNGVIPLGQVLNPSKGGDGGDGGDGKQPPKNKKPDSSSLEPSQKINGRLIQRGE